MRIVGIKCEILCMKISLQIALPPPGIRRRRFPGMSPLIKSEVDTTRQTEAARDFRRPIEYPEQNGHDCYRVDQLCLAADRNDVDHHIHAKEDQHLSEVGESEEGEHRHRSDDRERQEVAPGWQPPARAPEMPIAVRKRSCEAQQKNYLHAFPWRSLAQELSFLTDQHHDAKRHQRDEPDDQRVTLKPEQEFIAFEESKGQQHRQQARYRYVGVHRS